jgi:hypothetical protein
MTFVNYIKILVFGFSLAACSQRADGPAMSNRADVAGAKSNDANDKIVGIITSATASSATPQPIIPDPEQIDLSGLSKPNSKKIPSLSMTNGDTIEVCFMSIGCFHLYTEKMSIARAQDKYYVRFQSTRGGGNFSTAHVFDGSFATTMSRFQQQCLRLQKTSAGKIDYSTLSTTSERLFLKKGRIIVKLPDPILFEWRGYDLLRQAIVGG